ncbi:MAG: hypothetical protein AAFP81_19965, partial [Pseudomonadota bacterium]
SVRGEKETKMRDARMLDCEFTILEGEFAKRKFWGLMMITSNGSDGHDKAVNITKSRVRGILESAYGISPSDESEAALTARTLEEWMDLDNIEFLAKIGIEKSKDPQYPDKNVLKSAVTCDSEDYEGFTPVKPVSGMPPKTNGAAEAAGSGRWR